MTSETMSSDNYWEWTVSDFMSENETFYVYNGTTWDEYSDREAELGILAAVAGFLVLMVICTCFGCCYFDRTCLANMSGNRPLQRGEEHQVAKLATPEDRLLHCFARHKVTMEVTTRDILNDDPSYIFRPVTDVEAPVTPNSTTWASMKSLEEAKGQLRLNNGTLVPNCCAICLGAYHVGEKVVWSSNSECNHAFHERCILDWLIKMQPSTPSCPCCRQAFTDLPVQKEKKITWSGDAFNLGAVRF